MAAMTPPGPEAPTTADGPAATGHLRGVARGGLLNLAGSVVASVVTIGLTLVVTRNTAKGTAGVVFAATSFFLIAATIGKLGTQTSLVYFVSRLRALGRHDLVRPTIRMGLGPVVVVSSVMAVALWVAAPTLGPHLIKDDELGVTNALRGLALFLPLAALSDSLLAAGRGLRAMVPTVAVERLGRPLTQLLFTVVAVVAGWKTAADLSTAWAAPYLFSAVAAGLWLQVLLRRRDRRDRDVPPSDEPGVTRRQFWAFSGPRALTSIVQLALQRLDIVLIAALLGPAPAAVYTAASRFLVVGQLSNQAIAMSAEPRLGHLLAIGDVAGARTIYRATTAWLMIVAWPLYLLALPFAHSVLSLFGRGYTEGTTVVAILAGAMLVATACGMVDMLLNMAGRTTWTLANNVSALVVMVGLDVLLIPRMGIEGAAVGWAAAILTRNLVPLVQLKVSLGLDPFGRASGVVAVLAALCFGLLPLLARLAFGDSLPALLGATAVGSALYVGGLVAQRRVLQLDLMLASVRRRPREDG
jgi:O-antigen/teichoic acid export membrane protein